MYGVILWLHVYTVIVSVKQYSINKVLFNCCTFPLYAWESVESFHPHVSSSVLSHSVHSVTFSRPPKSHLQIQSTWQYWDHKAVYQVLSITVGKQHSTGKEREREIRTGEWILGLCFPKCLYKLVSTLMPSSENDRRTERPVVSEMVTVEASCFSHRMFSTFRWNPLKKLKYS